MKKLLVVSVLLASSAAFAQGVKFEVDYSNCQRALGGGYGFSPQLNHKGEFEGQSGMPAPDIQTVKLEAGSSQINYTFKYPSGPFNPKPTSAVYSVVKDKNGKLTKIINGGGGDTVDPALVKMQKQWMLEGATHAGLPFGSVTHDPYVLVGTNAQGLGGKFVPISKLSKKEAKEFGVDVDELKRLRQASKKDQKILKKIRDGYSVLLEKAPVMIPNGSEVAVEIKDNSCEVKSVSQRAFDPKNKKNHIVKETNRERCDKVLKVQKKYEKQLASCSETQMKMNQELFEGGYVGGSHGGYVGGIAGGYPGGGITGGFGAGHGIGGGFAAPGFGSQEVFECQIYFGEPLHGGFYMQGLGEKIQGSPGLGGGSVIGF